MKQLFFYAATAIILFGCSNDPEPGLGPNENNDEIKVSAILANVQPSTRTSIDGTGKASWINGDVLGLFCAQAKPSAASNVSFTVAGLPDSPGWTPASSIYWADGSTSHTFLAYAPYASGNTSAASVKIPALNSQTGTIAPAQDFLISNSSSSVTRPSNGTVGLTFTHAFSLINLQLTINSSIASGTTLQSVTLAGGTSDKLYTTDATSTIALATGVITPAASATTNTLTLTPSTPPTLSSTVTNFYIILLPGSYATTLQIVLSEGGTTINVPTASIASTAFAAGSKYTYTVAISRTAITLSNPTITDWTSVSSGSVSGGI